MTDFNDRPFVAGSLTGIRAFNIDKYGRLNATQLSAVWTPGENVARCFKELIGGYMPPGSLSQMIMGSPIISYYPNPFSTRRSDPPPKTSFSIPLVSETPPAPPKSTEHRVGALDCTCGFYAYFDNGPNQYYTPGRVRGLIEGYGVVTVGARGFRAEKASIKALIITPKKVTEGTNRVRVNYPDLPVFESKTEALEAFPLTPPATPTPDADPEFWTRETL